MPENEAVQGLDEELWEAALERLSPEQREAAGRMRASTARYLVDAYYQAQRHRIRAKQQHAADTRDSAIVERILRDATHTERTYQGALGTYARAHPVGQWSLSQKGIGPVLAAGLLAHIDIERATNVGKLWRFAGMDPTLPGAKKGEKRRYNATLKTLCWKIGESFVKVSGRDDAVYGHIYADRKQQEIARSEAGAFADQAAVRVEKVGKTTDAYKWYSEGKLPPAHLHARAKRYAVKLFLSHWHYVAFETRFGVAPEKPYILTKPEHSQHFIAPPGWPLEG